MKKDRNFGIMVGVDLMCILTVITSLIVVLMHIVESQLMIAWAPNTAGMAYPTAFCFINLAVALLAVNRTKGNGHHTS